MCKCPAFRDRERRSRRGENTSGGDGWSCARVTVLLTRDTYMLSFDLVYLIFFRFLCCTQVCCLQLKGLQHRQEGTGGIIQFYLPFPKDLPLPFPKDFPSNPGRALLLFFPTPLRFSLFRSFRIAMLSVRFFCLAAIEFASCSFRSSLDNRMNWTI